MKRQDELSGLYERKAQLELNIEIRLGMRDGANYALGAVVMRQLASDQKELEEVKRKISELLAPKNKPLQVPVPRSRSPRRIKPFSHHTPSLVLFLWVPIIVTVFIVLAAIALR